ncbi:MAG: Na+/H+ antiporter NhaA [Alphaproteobacteria bacterium]|nr:Na+/H+ antiporter NhaA [Alphaproteobacteria bacterium]MBL7098923.1 Na+/H+ antiporter NhaA [Alphaproteobacteria bacterium]
MAESSAIHTQLQRKVDPVRDHTRGGGAGDRIELVVYADYLCPYCRRLRHILARLRDALGERLAYTYRHFPNEKAHPGAEFVHAAAEAAGLQGKFWEMHDALYDHPLPIKADKVRQFAREMGLDVERFERDVASEAVRTRVADDLREGRANGVTGTPSFFVDGLRYDGAWDFHSMLEELQRPVAARLGRASRVFAALPASAGLVLLIAAALALLCANTALAPWYHALMQAPFGIGSPGSALSMTVGEWFSEGLLAIFFLIVGLEIRREMTNGSLTDFRAAALPVVCAIGGVLAPAAIYLALNPGPTAAGWSVPTATDIAFALGVLALLGPRAPVGLRVFVAALAVVDDILSVLTLAIFYPRAFEIGWLAGAIGATAALYVLNRARVYASWPYLVVAAVLWVALHGAGVHAALAGIVLAATLPTRPAPSVAPLLAQAATALAALEQEESERQEKSALQQEPIWEWASRTLSAASERLLSTADRFERAVAPWSAYVALPLFAFSATGVGLAVNLSSPEALHVVGGVVLGLALGKPLGICLAALAATATGTGRVPDDVTVRGFIGGACLCGIGDTVALLMADQAFPHSDDSAVAKIGVLIGSALAAALGAAVIAAKPLQPRTEQGESA